MPGYFQADIAGASMKNPW